MTLLLVSVVNESEARVALENAVDIVDLKNPKDGALGALPLATTQQVFEMVGGQKPVSATIGDLPMQPDVICPAVDQLVEIGVDYVKIGFFESQEYAQILGALSQYAEKGVKLIAVLLAEISYPRGLIALIRDAGFVGVMLDTAEKDGLTLFDHKTVEEVCHFVDSAKSMGLMVGVAGSLNASHLPLIKRVSASYAGFRGGVCKQNNRTANLSGEKIADLRKLM